MSKVLVVGYGNPLRADDGLGCHVAREIAHHLANDERLEVVPCHQLTPEVVEKIAHSEFVIFIDASTEGDPGTISEITVFPEATSSGDLGASFTPSALLAAARALHGSCPPAVLFTMTGWCFDFGEQMSTIVRERLQGLIRRVEKSIAEHETVNI